MTSNVYRLEPGTPVRVNSAAAESGTPMSISAPFINRPIATSLLMAGVLLVGIVAFPLLPVAPLPQVDFPTIQVTGQLPGASPETMASSVATPLETQFGAIPGVSQMTSTSVLGTTTIVVQFDLDRNIDAAAQDIQSAITAAGGPAAQEPAHAPQLQEGQSLGLADSHVLGQLRGAAGHGGR